MTNDLRHNFSTHNVAVAPETRSSKLRERRTEQKSSFDRNPVRNWIRNRNMFIREPKTFHEVVRPLVYFNCFVGIGAFRQPNQSDTTYLLMKLYTVIITLVNWAAIYITLNSMSQFIDFDESSPMALAMRTAIVSANSCITVTAALFVWLRRKALRDCVRHMVNLEGTFRAVLGVRNEYQSQYIRLNCQIMGILLATILVGICDTVVLILATNPRMNIQSVLMFSSFAQALHQPILVMLLLDVNFCTFVGYLGKKFQDLNDSVLGLVERPLNFCSSDGLSIISKNFIKNTGAESSVRDKHYLLREIRKAHWQLCKLSRKMNLAFGTQNLLSAAISFAMVTGLSYTIYSALSSWENFTNDKLWAVIVEAIWTIIYASKIWMVNHSCWSVSNEADRTGEVIYELLNSRVDRELQREIQEFGIQMLQNPVRFNACGFFTLDHTFVQGVIGSVTTYLIILIQMSHVSANYSTSNTAPARNGTEILTN